MFFEIRTENLQESSRILYLELRTFEILWDSLGFFEILMKIVSRTGGQGIEFDVKRLQRLVAKYSRAVDIFFLICHDLLCRRYKGFREECGNPIPAPTAAAVVDLEPRLWLLALHQ